MLELQASFRVRQPRIHSQGTPIRGQKTDAAIWLVEKWRLNQHSSSYVCHSKHLLVQLFVLFTLGKPLQVGGQKGFFLLLLSGFSFFCFIFGFFWRGLIGLCKGREYRKGKFDTIYIWKEIFVVLICHHKYIRLLLKNWPILKYWVLNSIKVPLRLLKQN